MWRPLSLFVLVLLSLGATTVSPFAIAWDMPPSRVDRRGQANPRLRPSALATRNRIPRGGGGSQRIFSAAAAPDTNESAASPARAADAVSAIRFTVRMTLAAVACDLFVLCSREDLWNRFLGPHPMLARDYVDLFDSVTTLIFGGGLYKIATIYDRGAEDVTRRMERHELLGLFKTMGTIWGLMAANWSIRCVLNAASLAMIEGGILSGLLGGLSTDHLVRATIAIILVGYFLVQNNTKRAAMSEVSARVEAEKRRGARPNLDNDEQSRFQDSGFDAYFSQRLCAATAGFATVISFIKWVASFKGQILAQVLSVSDFLEPMSITLLLYGLNRALLRAAVAEIRTEKVRNVDNENERAIYQDLFEAQTKFYTKVGTVLKSA